MRPLKHMAIALQTGFVCSEFKGYGHEFRPVTAVIRDMQGGGKAFELTLDPTASWVFPLCVQRAAI